MRKEKEKKHKDSNNCQIPEARIRSAICCDPQKNRGMRIRTEEQHMHKGRSRNTDT